MFSVLPEVLSRQVLLHTIQNVVYCYKNTFEYQFEAISFAVCHSPVLLEQVCSDCQKNIIMQLTNPYIVQSKLKRRNYFFNGLLS